MFNLYIVFIQLLYIYLWTDNSVGKCSTILYNYSVELWLKINVCIFCAAGIVDKQIVMVYSLMALIASFDSLCIAAVHYSMFDTNLNFNLNKKNLWKLRMLIYLAVYLGYRKIICCLIMIIINNNNMI